jgi:hypothetical protein
MWADCDSALTLTGPFFVLFGSFFAYVGFAALFKPDSKIVQENVVNQYTSEQKADRLELALGLTRESAGLANLRIMRLIGGPIGILFTVLGLWMSVSAIRCGARLPSARPLLGPLDWHPIGIIFGVFAGAIGLWNARRMRPILRELSILLSILFGVAASEAAAFHVGVQAGRWFAIGVIALLAAAGLQFLNEKISPKRK